MCDLIVIDLNSIVIWIKIQRIFFLEKQVMKKKFMTKTGMYVEEVLYLHQHNNFKKNRLKM